MQVCDPVCAIDISMNFYSSGVRKQKDFLRMGLDDQHCDQAGTVVGTGCPNNDSAQRSGSPQLRAQPMSS